MGRRSVIPRMIHRDQMSVVVGTNVCGCGDLALMVDAPLSLELSVGGDGDVVERYVPSPPE